MYIIYGNCLFNIAWMLFTLHMKSPRKKPEMSAFGVFEKIEKGSLKTWHSFCNTITEFVITDSSSITI